MGSQPTPDERLTTARNQVGNARLQVTRMPDTPTARAAVALLDESLHELSCVPKFPPSVPGEASLYFEHFTLEQAVEKVLKAVLPGEPIAPEAVADVVSTLAAPSDWELEVLSGHRATPTTQAGLPLAPSLRGRLGPGRPA